MRSVVVCNLWEGLLRAEQAPRTKAVPKTNVWLTGRTPAMRYGGICQLLHSLRLCMCLYLQNSLQPALQRVREVVQVLVYRRGLCLKVSRA